MCCTFCEAETEPLIHNLVGLHASEEQDQTLQVCSGMPHAQPVFNMWKQAHRGTEISSEMLKQVIIFNKFGPPSILKIVLIEYHEIINKYKLRI
jgi:hypothetical protein